MRSETIKSYGEALAALGGRDTRKIGNNTVLRFDHSDSDPCIAVRYHSTDVVRYYRDRVVLNSGGWHTYTTKDRLNRFGPVRVWQDDFEWYTEAGAFYDGMEVTP